MGKVFEKVHRNGSSSLFREMKIKTLDFEKKINSLKITSLGVDLE